MEIHPRLRALARRLIELSAGATGITTRVATRHAVAALTFDDGPDPEWTPRLLDVLERHGARGTFFMVGKSAARWPELVARVASAGHAIANHTWDHPSLPTLRGRYRRRQIRWCEEALAPHGVKLFRPPYGHLTPAVQLGARLLGYRVVTGNIVAEDWRDDSAETLVERVERRLGPGAIVLLHDRLYTTVDERFSDRRPTLCAVELLLERWAGRLRFTTVPELLSLGSARKRHDYHRPDLAWLKRLV